MTSAQRVVRLNSAVTRPAMVRTGNNARGHRAGDAIRVFGTQHAGGLLRSGAKLTATIGLGTRRRYKASGKKADPPRW